MGDPFERAWFVSNIDIIADDKQAITRLAADDFDLRRYAIVAAPVNLPFVGVSTATVAVQKNSPTLLQLKTDTLGDHLLVVSQIFYPGWQATIDGEPADLLRVNVVQQGLVVPSGEHIVEISYWPHTFSQGVIISTVALVICGGMLLLSHLKKPNP
jgi:hypothetical protein